MGEEEMEGGARERECLLYPTVPSMYMYCVYSMLTLIQ